MRGGGGENTSNMYPIKMISKLNVHSTASQGKIKSKRDVMFVSSSKGSVGHFIVSLQQKKASHSHFLVK